MPSAALIPCAPVLLPEITGPDTPELAALRSAVADACRHVVESRADVIVVAAPGSTGGIGGFGAPVADDLPAGLSVPGWTWELGVRLLVRHGAVGRITTRGLDAAPTVTADAALLVLSDGFPTKDPVNSGVALFLAGGTAPPRVRYEGAPLGVAYMVALR